MIGWAFGIACIAFAVWGHFGPHAEPYYRDPPAKAPERPVVASDAGERLLIPFQLAACLAWLCWAAILLCVFLAPLAFLALVVWGALQ